MRALLLFPHQLYPEISFEHIDHVFMIEDPLYFTQYTFHKQKLAFHRASMRKYFDEIKLPKTHIEFHDEKSTTERLFGYLKSSGYTTVCFFDPTDYLLERRIRRYGKAHAINLDMAESPNFLCTKEYIQNYFKGKKRFFFNAFYIDQRKRLGILLDAAGEPVGGKWTYDAENRKKMPTGTIVPKIPTIKKEAYINEAIDYVEKHFPQNYGSLENWYYPIDRNSSLAFIDSFLEERFHHFGEYQDAIVKGGTTLFHSILTPMLNVGLISPHDVVERTLRYAATHDVPLNSLEGFIRQVIGWREYIRAVYLLKGVEERTKNFFNHQRAIPENFWTGNTQIAPIDDMIHRLQKTAYAHHIERLMVMGNYFALREFHPDEVYRWFMEMFIDAYDWVMVPNVYGMSQYADGGIMSTKPYISGSNYILKMSDFKKGPWCEEWDHLYWRFIDKHRTFFLKNPRMAMMVRMLDKKKPSSGVYGERLFD
jgi:deoxyribodipyrimidine photolyase-related protein